MVRRNVFKLNTDLAGIKVGGINLTSENGILRKIKNGLYNSGRKIQEIIVPDLRNSQYDYFYTLKNSIPQDSKWLDIGCSEMLFYDWINDIDNIESELKNKTTFIAGIDASDQNIKKNKTVDFKMVADINHLPFKDNSFDFISANMVIEHINDPKIATDEIYRILSPGSKYIFHTPNILNYGPIVSYIFSERMKKKLIKFLEGRVEDDVFPTRYKMNSKKKIMTIIEKSNFKVKSFYEIQSSPLTTMFSIFVIFELLLIKLLKTNMFKNFRSNFIVVTEKI